MAKKNRAFQKGVSLVLTAALVITGVTFPTFSTNADEKEAEIRVQTDEFTVEKISNKDKGQGEIDGLIEGGDRYNSYAWCMAARGDKLYIGTIRGLSETVIGTMVMGLQAKGMSKDQAYALIDTITNNNFGHDPIDKGGDIISYDTKTGEMKVLKTGVPGTSYRMAINYNGDIYIGSYAGTKNNIYRIDENDNIEEVYETVSGTSMRAACEFEGDLYFGGVDSSEVLTEEYAGATKLAILKMDKENPSKWDRVADYSDFEVVYAKDPAVKSQITSPIWDIVSYGGYIYATLPYSHGFIAYKGRPAVGDETKNEYGWHWEEVIGLTNGINNVALADQLEGYTGEEAGNLSMTATPFVFKDKLYIMDFDNTLGSMTTTLMNILNPTSVEKGKLLSKMYTTLNHPQSLWVLDDATGKFEKVENFTKLMEGTCNEYLWRTAEYDGELYITTMDSSVIYRYLTQYTDLGMDLENLEDKATSIINIGKVMEAFNLDESEDESVQRIAKIVIALGHIVEKVSENLTPEEVEELEAKYQQLTTQLKAYAKEFLNKLPKNEPEEETTEEVTTEETTAEETTAEETTEEEPEAPNLLDNLAKMIIISISQKAMENENIAELIIKVSKAVSEVDWETLYMYDFIADRVNNEVQGFDMFKTADGVNFSVVTNNGFGDRYNYGGRTLQPTEDGLYIGTSNPFYGAQLFKLTNIKTEPETETTTEETTAEETTQPEQETTQKKQLEVKRTKVVVKPQKTIHIAYAADEKVQVTSSNKKLVKAAVKNGTIEIKTTKAAKKKRGTIVKVTVQSGNEKKVIKVAIRNSAKKISAKKKKYSVKNGKTLKVTFKVVKAQNKKKAVTNLFIKKAKVTATIKDIATVKRIKAKKGKIVVEIAAIKKGTAKLKLRLSKKVKASTKIVVK